MKYLFYFLLLLLASELHVNYARRLKHIKSLETELKRKSRVQSRRILHRKDEIEKPSNETSSSTNSTKFSDSSDTESSSTTDLGTSTDHKTIDEKNDDKNDTIGADKRSHFLPHTHVDLDGVNLKNETEKKDEETHKYRTHATHHDEDLSDINNSTTYIAKNVTTSNGEKKGLLESGGSKKDGSSKKGMSAIVVIGNRTHRVSGPVVKQLLSELQRQNTDEDYKKGKKVGKEVGQAGDSNGNLKRLHAANEVAEINKLLGKPLTDDRALGLIKNLLLDKVHSHLAKTMDLDQLQEMADQTLVDSQSIAANQPSRGGEPQRGLLGLLKNAQLQQETPCRDLDSKEKCTYLKDMGLCAEAATNPHIKRRCQETCQLCDQSPPGASAPATSTVTHLVALPPPPPAVAVPPPPVAGQPPQQIAAIVAAAPAIPPPLPPPASVSVSLSPSLPPPPAPTAACPVPCPPATCPPACAPPLPSVVTPICLPGCGTASTSPCEEPCVPVHSHLTTALPVVRRTTPSVSAETAVVPPTSPPECEVEVIRRPITCPPLLRTTVAPDLVVNIANTASPLRPSTMLPLIAGTRAPVLALAQPAVPAPVAKCTQPMDIGIALDTSAATVAHWPHIQQFCKNLVDKFQLGGNVARIGLITFDTIAKVPVHLDTYHDSNALKLHCNRLVPDPYGRRRTDSALDVARERLFTTARQGIPKMLFLLEHGKINGGDPSINWNQQLIEPSQKLKEMGVNVFAVGATPIAGVDELKTITSTVDDQSHVIPLQGYAQLPAVVNQIAQKACKLAGIVHPNLHNYAAPTIAADDISSLRVPTVHLTTPFVMPVTSMPPLHETPFTPSLHAPTTHHSATWPNHHPTTPHNRLVNHPTTPHNRHTTIKPFDPLTLPHIVRPVTRPTPHLHRPGPGITTVLGAKTRPTPLPHRTRPGVTTVLGATTRPTRTPTQPTPLYNRGLSNKLVFKVPTLLNLLEDGSNATHAKHSVTRQRKPVDSSPQNVDDIKNLKKSKKRKMKVLKNHF